VSGKHVVSDLKASSERVGRLYPVLLDRHGNVIDGRHRLAADENWPKLKLENVETEEQRLLARLISNVCRRHVSAEEKTEVLGRLGETYLKEGVETGKIAYKIAERTGMSYRWVAKYLPDKFKDNVQSERAAAVAARRAAENDSIDPPMILSLRDFPRFCRFSSSPRRACLASVPPHNSRGSPVCAPIATIFNFLEVIVHQIF